MWQLSILDELLRAYSYCIGGETKKTFELLNMCINAFARWPYNGRNPPVVENRLLHRRLPEFCSYWNALY